MENRHQPEREATNARDEESGVRIKAPGIPTVPLPLKLLRRSSMLSAAILAPLLGAPAGKPESALTATPKPNIVLIVADQWRAQALGCAGDPNVHTPQLDRFQREGISFTHAVASVPVCSPTRASLLTGQRPLTHGVFVNDVQLALTATTIAKTLGGAGYDTAYIGKWHVDGRGRSNFIPRERRQGFEYWKVLECTHDYNHSAYYADGPQKLYWTGYDAVAQTRDAQEYLRNRASVKKPFLLVLAWGPPHDPYGQAPPDFKALYADKQLELRPNVPSYSAEKARQDLVGYYGHCAALDTCFGEVRQTLHEVGLEENTIMVFTSDHGDLLGSHGGQNKQQPYDESIRIPFLMRWPFGLGVGTRLLSAPITSEDVMPTLLALAGVSIPKTVEGLDFSGYIRGGVDPSGGDVLVSCPSPFGQWTRAVGGREYRGLRTARYTYVRDLKGPWLLFDNERDPYQLDNVVNRPEYASVQSELEARLQQKLTRYGDEFLPGPTYLARWGHEVDATGTVRYTL